MTSRPTPPADLVSVVIPCHGHARFLAAAIDSALAQDHRPLEVVVVDDGSPDDTAEVASSYAEVVLVRQEQAGLSAARNAGLRASSGAMVAFLDADDLLMPGGIRAGVEALRSRPEVAFTAGGHVRVDDAGRALPVSEAERVADGDDAYLALLRGNWIGMHAAVLYRREAVEAAGGFDPSLPACEDYDLYLRIARERPVSQHDAVVASYRRHGDNMSQDVRLMMGEIMHVLDRQLPHVVDDPARFDALRHGLWNFSTYYLDQLSGGPMSAPSPDQFSAGVTARRQLRRALRVARGVRRRVGEQVRDRSASASTDPAPPVGTIDFGDLRRTDPISRDFGYSRGTPIDRVFIEAFLDQRRADIRGRVLEIGDDTYTRRFGGDRVVSAEVLHVATDDPAVTYVGTLEDGAGLPSDSFDCIVLTQTLQLVFDVDAALRTVQRVLRPGGVLLATVPGITQIASDQWSATWSWSFTPYSIRHLLEAAMPGAVIDIAARGNVLTSTAFLQGIAAEELTTAEMDPDDPTFPMLITARAVKAG